MTTRLNCGILYCATGADCRAEAMVSARSVKAVWPQVPIAIITDEPIDAAYFDIVQVVAVDRDKLDRVRYIGQSPFERTIALDSDTFCLHPFPELFDLLDRFDLAAAHEAGRFATTSAGAFIRVGEIPECFPELNTGVLAFRRQANVLDMLGYWHDACRAVRQNSIPHTQDQPSFRRVIYESGLRVAVLPPEYNFRLVCPGYARTAIKIIHGRWKDGPIAETSEEVFSKLGATFNANLGPRVFVHALGMICGHGPHALPFDNPYQGGRLGYICQAELDRQAEKTKWLESELDRQAEKTKWLESELESMRRSRSWRVTRPLRAVSRRLHRLGQ